MTKAKEIAIKITSAIVLGGEVVRPDTVITVTEREAKNLLQRGKAELAVSQDKAPAKSKAKAKADEPAVEPAAEE